MEYSIRAKNAIDRSMPHVLRSKFPGWEVNIRKEVARALRRCERDAYRAAMTKAANTVGSLLGSKHQVFHELVALIDEKPPK